MVFHRRTNSRAGLSRAWAERCDRPHNNQNNAMRAAAVGSGIAAFLMVGLRIVSRLCTFRFWWDDWCHITAGVCRNCTRCFTVMTPNGYFQVLAIPLTIFSNLCTFVVVARNQVTDRATGVTYGMGYHFYDIKFSSMSEARRLFIWCKHIFQRYPS